LHLPDRLKRDSVTVGGGVRSLIDPYPLGSYVESAAKRNRDPILDLFKQLFPASGDALELASGSGAHINYFAPHFPHIRFQPP
jgi:Protein of unknown function (DUF938)